MEVSFRGRRGAAKRSLTVTIRPQHDKSTGALCILRLAVIKVEVGEFLLVLSKSERLRRYCFFLAALCLCLTEIGAAGWAQGLIDETRIGMLEPIDGPPGDKFGAPNVNVEVLFDRFGPEYQSSVLNHFLRPRLDIGTSISTDGDTSEVYAGLTWDVFLTRRLFLEGSAGGALHNGDNRDFGCTANFRESGSVGVMLSERWDLLATVDHMSDANLCDKNRGLTDVGIRFGRKW
jgi:lipid A 3-O-deacylase